MRVVLARRGHRTSGIGESRLAVALYAFGVRAVQRQPGEELRRHASAPADVVERTGGAGAGTLRRAQFPEQLRGPPDAGEAPVREEVPGEEVVVDGERAGVDVADRIDEAHDSAGPAHVEPGQFRAEARQVEERVPGEHFLACPDQPFVQVPLLCLGWVQFVPHVGTPPGRPEPGQPQRRAVLVGDAFELVQLAHVVACDDDGDLGVTESGGREVVQRAHRHVVGTRTAYPVVDRGCGAVEGHLYVDVVRRGEVSGPRRIYAHTVGGELHADLMLHRVGEQVPEVRSHRGFATPDVHVEHLHGLEFVDHRLALTGGEFAWVASARRGQAVHTGQVAGVGEFPRQTDRCGQSPLEAFHQGIAGPGACRVRLVHGDTSPPASAAVSR